MVCGNSTAVCGWAELFDANLIGAAFTMYDAALLGWFVVMLFFVYQIMLWLKTGNLNLMWITGLLFVSLYATSTFVKASSVWIMIVMLILELGIILYVLIFK